MVGARAYGRWYYGWTVVLAAVVIQAVSTGCIWYGFTLWVHPWMEAFKADNGKVLSAVSLMVVMMGLSSPLGGKALEVMPVRLLVTAGACLQALGFLLIARATALWQIILIYATLVPLGATLNGPLIGQTLAVRWFTKRRELAIGIAATGTPIGALFVPHLIFFLFTHFGWRTANVMIAGFVILAIVPLSLLVLRRMRPAEAAASYAAEASVQTGGQANRDWKVVQILREPTFWLLAVGVVSLNILLMAFQTNVGPRVVELGLGAQHTANLISAYATALIACNVAFGRMLGWVDARYIYWLSAAAMACTVLLNMGHPGLERLFAAQVTMGMCEGALLPVVGVVLTRHFGTQPFPVADGLMMALLIGVGALGPVAMGSLRDLTGHYQLPLRLGLLLVVVASLVIGWLPSSGASPRLELRDA